MFIWENSPLFNSAYLHAMLRTVAKLQTTITVVAAGVTTHTLDNAFQQVPGIPTLSVIPNGQMVPQSLTLQRCGETST
jgi:hypothetical protein